MQPIGKWFSKSGGSWKTTSWWNSANVLEVVIDYTKLTGSSEHIYTIPVVFKKHAGGKFLNKFYDDEGWWALALIKAYDLTQKTEYLEMAKTIFGDMKTGWDDHCGGGIWWTKDRTYKNAIANELFMTLALRLHQRTPGDIGAGSYRDWADKEWLWFKNSGMINASNLVHDGLNERCQAVGQTFTYNQGVILGALTDFYAVTRDQSLLDQANAIATAAMKTLVDSQGILRDDGETPASKNPDQPQFKGIFMRNLAYLYKTQKKTEYREFILHNVESIWNVSRNQDNQFGYLWNAPFDVADAARQSSAIDAINAAILVSEAI
jgi:predicted alpha-1,6-mannanase (GH76 family)